MNVFGFELTEKVRIKVSDEYGEIIGCVQYINNENAYLIRYKASDGSTIENWWNESALEITE